MFGRGISTTQSNKQLHPKGKWCYESSNVHVTLILRRERKYIYSAESWESKSTQHNMSIVRWRFQQRSDDPYKTRKLNFIRGNHQLTIQSKKVLGTLHATSSKTSTHQYRTGIDSGPITEMARRRTGCDSLPTDERPPSNKKDPPRTLGFRRASELSTAARRKANLHRRLKMTVPSFFAVACLLTFAFPADGLVYQTNDAIIIEDANLMPSSNPFMLAKNIGDLYGAAGSVYPYYAGLLFGSPVSFDPWARPADIPAQHLRNRRPASKNTCGAGPTKTLSFDEQRVVGGVEAEKNAWPGIVALRFNSNFFCGGSLIARDHVLTAAHCVDWITETNIKYLTVELGMHTVKPSDAQEVRTVRRLTIHGGWNPDTNANDIAILTLSSPVTYTSTVSPVCLPPSRQYVEYVDQDAAIVGWGLTSDGGSVANVLQQATVQTVTNSQCTRSYPQLISSMLCAAAPGKDTCQGDSGGPIFIRSSSGSPWTQVGIVSYGAGCADPNYPGVYTRVTSFRTWIAAYTNV